jgi:hypothetical protein
MLGRQLGQLRDHGHRNRRLETFQICQVDWAIGRGGDRLMEVPASEIGSSDASVGHRDSIGCRAYRLTGGQGTLKRIDGKARVARSEVRPAFFDPHRCSRRELLVLYRKTKLGHACG